MPHKQLLVGQGSKSLYLLKEFNTQWQDQERKQQMLILKQVTAAQLAPCVYHANKFDRNNARLYSKCQLASRKAWSIQIQSWNSGSCVYIGRGQLLT